MSLQNQNVLVVRQETILLPTVEPPVVRGQAAVQAWLQHKGFLLGTAELPSGSTESH